MPNLQNAFGKQAQSRPRLPEKDVQAQIIDWINGVIPGAWAYRQNTGSVIIPKNIDEATGRVRKARRVKYGMPGQSDLGGILKIYTSHYPKPLGIALQIEVKAEKRKPGHTEHDEEQAAWIDNFNSRGGVAFWANSLDMAISKMRQAFQEHGFPWSQSWEVQR